MKYPTHAGAHRSAGGPSLALKKGNLAIDASLLELIQRYGVPLIALMVFAGELGVPTGIPVEVALLLAGSYAVHSRTGLLVGLVLVTVADVLGTTALHLAARTGGVRLLQRFVRQESDRDGFVQRWIRRLGGHAALVVFVGRLLPLVRMPITIATGLLRFRLRDFFLGAVPAALLWAGTPLVAGYYFRGSVHRFETRYTQFSHLFLITLPAVGLIAAIAWWVRRGETKRAAWRRGRSAIGIAVALSSLIFLIKIAWTNERAIDRGLVALPYPLLFLWLTLIAALAFALLAVAGVDLRAAYRMREGHAPLPAVVKQELLTSLVWAGSVCLVGVIMTAIELHYPAI